MSKPKYAHISEVDIHTLETIYSDGRAMGRLLQEYKDDLAKVRSENAELQKEVYTLEFRLKALNNLYLKACRTGAPANGTDRGLPRSSFEKRRLRSSDAEAVAGQNGTR